MQELKESLATKQTQLQQTEQEWNEILRRIPNLIADDVPVGKTDEDNQVLEYCNPKPEFSFEPKTHRELLESL